MIMNITMKSIFLLCLISLCSAVDVEKFKLNNGVSVPVVALGTGTGTGSGDVLFQMVRDAIDVGYRHIDTAYSYRNEKQVGQLINEAISSGKVTREEIFVTTKIDREHAGHAKALSGVKESLQTMNLTYLDSMLIHHPLTDAENSDTWAGLEEAFNAGLVKSIGVSNFNVAQLTALLKTAKVIPTVNQIQSHPKLNEDDIVAFSKSHNITVSAYSPLGHGSITLLDDTTLMAIATKHSKTTAQVMLRWQIQRGVFVITKSTNKDRLLEDLELFDFTLTDEEMKTIDAMH